jgi:hypothetical protein
MLLTARASVLHTWEMGLETCFGLNAENIVTLQKEAVETAKTRMISKSSNNHVSSHRAHRAILTSLRGLYLFRC